MSRIQVTAVVGHSTHDYNGRQVWHDAGTSYDVDASDVDNLEALGFAKRSNAGPDPVQMADDSPVMTTGPELAPPTAKSKRK